MPSGRSIRTLAVITQVPNVPVERRRNRLSDRRRQIAQDARSARSVAADWFPRGVGFVGGGLFVYGFVGGIVGAREVLLLFFFALLLASALAPVVDRLRDRLPLARGGALLLVYVAFFGTVVLLGLIIVPDALRQVSEVVAALPPALQRARDASQTVEPAALRTSLGAIIDAAIAALRPGPAPAAGQVVETGLAALNVVVSVTTTLALVYFWMTERARLQRFVLSFSPPERRQGVREAWNAVELRLGNWVRGQLTLMASLAVMTGIAYTVLGLPAALLLAVLAGLAEVIPIVGPAIGAAPAVIVAAALKPEVLPFLVVAYIVIQLVEGNVLVPIVMRNAIGVSPLLIILSLLAGAALGGFVGALVAVPVAAAVEAILERLQDRDVPIAQDAAAARNATDQEEMTGIEEPRPEGD
jgi:predicted PurR-regulated permease PerM